MFEELRAFLAQKIKDNKDCYDGNTPCYCNDCVGLRGQNEAYEIVLDYLSNVA